MPEILVDQDRAREHLAKLGRDAANAEWKEQAAADKLHAQMSEAESESAPESWLTMSRQAVDFTANRVCPAWELTDDERGMASQSVAEVLDHYFPGAVEGFDAWHPLAKLAGTMFFIVAMRIDFQTGRIAPLRKKERSNGNDGESERRLDDSDGGQEPQRKNAGHFAIGEGA